MTALPRLFIAVWPTDDVVADLSSLHRKDQRGVRFVPPDDWHITLRFLGETDPREVSDALDLLRAGPARAVIGPGVDVLDERALVLPVRGLDALAASVVEATRHLGRPPRRRFVGHLTVARVKPYASMPRALGALVNAEFDVDEIALVQSRLGPDRARYETLATWPLTR